MANEKNLKSIGERTTKEQREITKKGGIKSGEVRRKRKAMKEQLETILSLPLSLTLKDNHGQYVRDKYKSFGIDEKELDNQMAISIELFLTAIGNSKAKIQAIRTIMEIIKDEEERKIDNERKVIIVDDIKND